MKIEVETDRMTKTFEGEQVTWDNLDGYLKVFVNRNLQAEFRPGHWDSVLVVDDEVSPPKPKRSLVVG